MDSKSGVVAEENTVSSKGIRKKVKNSETIALQRYKIDNYNLLDLDKVLNDVYCSFRPLSSDYETRKHLVNSLNSMALDIYGNSKDSSPVLKAYGSFVMDMFSTQSDLDISINFDVGTSELPRDTKLKILKRFAKKLRSLEGEGYVRKVESIFSAKVPIVKFVDQGTDVECDLSVENKGGILMSYIINSVSQIDDRFQKLCMLIKHWAKAQEVNSALRRTLNSVSITLLVAHHLQTQDPPILPPFSILFKDGIDPLSVEKRTQRFLKWGQRNKESLGRLFVTFFIKLQSVEFLWKQGLCVSLLNGLWISKTWKKSGSIGVEDFTDSSQNCARRVNGEGAKKIYGSINRTVEDLFVFLNGNLNGLHLKNMLFGKNAVMEPPPLPPPMPPLNVYPQEARNDYRNELNNRKKRVRSEIGYKDVRGTGRMIEEEERYESLRGDRKRYAGNFNSFEPLYETPLFGIHNEPLEDTYLHNPLNGGGNGHLSHHRYYDGRVGCEAPPPLPPVCLWRDYNRRIDMAPPLPHSPYGRVYYENSGPGDFPGPYFGRRPPSSYH
ncbi:unnamed protein product [Cochlearia groenlandica]